MVTNIPYMYVFGINFNSEIKFSNRLNPGTCLPYYGKPSFRRIPSLIIASIKPFANSPFSCHSFTFPPFLAFPLPRWQASLFRIFQSVFHAPKDAHQVELRRLGVYIVRQFTALAPNNPKIYAELLFYKSIKEANAIEMGYEDIYGNSM